GRVQLRGHHVPGFSDDGGERVAPLAGKVLGIAVRVPQVRRAADHPGRALTGVGVGGPEHRRPVVECGDDRLVGILLDVAALDDGVVPRQMGGDVVGDRVGRGHGAPFWDLFWGLFYRIYSVS